MARTLFLALFMVVFSFQTLIKPVLSFGEDYRIRKQQELDRIVRLPGQPEVGFNQFSGYVIVNENHGRALFYWLTESVSDPEKKPLVLWLNGDANLLFLESPAGVGFSYTNTSSDLENSGDNRTAEDALVFLVRWMSRFPQYKYREFYIAGESYAGHYVPQLTKKVNDYNKAYSKPIFNLKGFLVGNAAIDNKYGWIGTVTYGWSHAMISDKSYKTILNVCNFLDSKSSDECHDAMVYATDHEFGDIDQYNIYTPKCLVPENNETGSRVLRFSNTILHRRVLSGYDPCVENYAEMYYNREDVQRALHANLTKIPYKWTACSDVLLYHWKNSETSMFPIYKELMAAGLRIWVYSGDTDSIIPVTATRFSLSQMNLTVKTPWYPWYSGNQVGGRTEIYHGLTFATIRGAGHEVPMFQPRRALVLFRSFLAGKQLPGSPK